MANGTCFRSPTYFQYNSPLFTRSPARQPPTEITGRAISTRKHWHKWERFRPQSGRNVSTICTTARVVEQAWLGKLRWAPEPQLRLAANACADRAQKRLERRQKHSRASMCRGRPDTCIRSIEDRNCCVWLTFGCKRHRVAKLIKAHK